MKLCDQLAIEFTTLTADRAVLTCPVTGDMLQPFGVLHGGISAYLAEHCASYASIEGLKDSGAQPCGLNLESTHLLPVMEGDTIRTTATLVRGGGRTQVWDVEQARLSDGETFNVSRLTIYIKRPR